MKPDQLRKAYQNFFKTEAGKYLAAELHRLIRVNHENAESDPELSRDYTQRACGVREVLTHIQTIQTESKKGGAAK